MTHSKSGPLDRDGFVADMVVGAIAQHLPNKLFGHTHQGVLLLDAEQKAHPSSFKKSVFPIIKYVLHKRPSIVSIIHFLFEGDQCRVRFAGDVSRSCPFCGLAGSRGDHHHHFPRSLSLAAADAGPLMASPSLAGVS